MPHPPMIEVNLVELEHVLKPLPLLCSKHRHVLAVITVRPFFRRDHVVAPR